MEAKEFEVRKEELVDECCVAPQIWNRVMPRLEQFMKPFINNLVRREQNNLDGKRLIGFRHAE